jgi:formylglycine-generating enzyme required for sulfatase activity
MNAKTRHKNAVAALVAVLMVVGCSKRSSDSWNPADSDASPATNASIPSAAVAPFPVSHAKSHQQAWANYLKVAVEHSNSVGARMILLPPGEYSMGETGEDIDEAVQQARRQKMHTGFINAIRASRPQHLVRLTRPFYVSSHEITVSQFAKFVEALRYQTEAEKDGRGGLTFDPAKQEWSRNLALTWKNPAFAQTPSHPVVLVSWNDATSFCVWLSGKEGRVYRLPTEVEWEYACRAGTTSRWQTGDDPQDLQRSANLADARLLKEFPRAQVMPWDDGFGFTAPVGRYQANAFGLFDMHGNVLEWCQDWYDPKYYERSPSVDPPGPASGKDRVLRGGAWCLPAILARSGGHDGFDAPSERSPYTGFRVVCEAPGAP